MNWLLHSDKYIITRQQKEGLVRPPNETLLKVGLAINYAISRVVSPPPSASEFTLEHLSDFHAWMRVKGEFPNCPFHSQQQEKK